MSSTSPESRPSVKRKREPADDPQSILANGRLSLDLPTCGTRKLLRIEIPPVETIVSMSNGHREVLTSPLSDISLPDSLFDEQASPTSVIPLSSGIELVIPALRTAPPIPGLFFTPTVRLPEEVADAVTRFCLDTYFQAPGVNQVMLFGRFSTAHPESNAATEKLDGPSLPNSLGLPAILLQLLATLDAMLSPLLPPEPHELLFPRIPKRARQAILNLYDPGEGISPHVDLLRRFGDGIVGVSLGSGCTMQFTKGRFNSNDEQTSPNSHTEEREHWGVYLPERSVIVLSEEARYSWKHGIDKCTEDYVAAAGSELDGSTGQWIQRGVRLSITFRWLLPGADIVGED